MEPNVCTKGSDRTPGSMGSEAGSRSCSGQQIDRLGRYLLTLSMGSVVFCRQALQLRCGVFLPCSM